MIELFKEGIAHDDIKDIHSTTVHFFPDVYQNLLESMRLHELGLVVILEGKLLFSKGRFPFYNVLFIHFSYKFIKHNHQRLDP